jgi:hypothetical protein
LGFPIANLSLLSPVTHSSFNLFDSGTNPIVGKPPRWIGTIATIFKASDQACTASLTSPDMNTVDPARSGVFESSVFASGGVRMTSSNMPGNGAPHQGTWASWGNLTGSARDGDWGINSTDDPPILNPPVALFFARLVLTSVIDNGFAQMNGEATLFDFDDPSEFSSYPSPRNALTTWLPVWWLHCDCHGHAFRKRADLARHLNKENQRFKCEMLDCPSISNGNLPCFGTLNDKKRHYRDVHSMTLEGQPLDRFYCPWMGCRRHSDGFPRKQNLENHIKSLHGGKEPEDLTAEDLAGSQAGPSTQLPPPLTAAPSDLMKAPIPHPTSAPPSQPIFPGQNSIAPDSQMPPVPPLTTATSMESIAVLSADEEADMLLVNMANNISEHQQRFAELKDKLTVLQTQMDEILCDSKQMEEDEVLLKRSFEERRLVVRKRRAARKAKKSSGIRKST